MIRVDQDDNNPVLTHNFLGQEMIINTENNIKNEINTVG